MTDHNSCQLKNVDLCNWIFILKLCNDMNKLDTNVLYFSPLNERVWSEVLRWIRLLGFFCDRR